MRTRIYGKLTNAEVERYLDKNNLIFIAAGTTELHGALPLDCESVLTEAICLKLADQADGLMLPNLPYLYSGATATGRGTLQLSVRAGMDFLFGISSSLLRQGFRRQIYLSFHGPGHMTICPMIRDFFDKYQAPIMYLDAMLACQKSGIDFLADNMLAFHQMCIGAYQVMGCLEDVPLTTEEILDCSKQEPQSVAFANDLFGRAYQSGAVGYYFGKHSDHMPTPKLESAEQRKAYADAGEKIIDQLVDSINIKQVVDRLAELDRFNQEEVLPKYGDWLKF